MTPQYATVPTSATNKSKRKAAMDPPEGTSHNWPGSNELPVHGSMSLGPAKSVIQAGMAIAAVTTPSIR